MKFISVPIFLISLSVGVLFTYLTTPRPNIIFVYPTPENIDDIQYKDESGTCFRFEPKEQVCPSDKSHVRTYPVQTIEKADPLDLTKL